MKPYRTIPLLLLTMANAIAQSVPNDVIQSFLAINPNIARVDLMAAARTQGTTFYVLWGEVTPPPGEKPDSSFVEEQAFAVAPNGQVIHLNRDTPPLPAENWTDNKSLARAINDDYVTRRTASLGGREKTQDFLLSKSFMPGPIALAWTRAGFAIGSNTKIIPPGGRGPFIPAPQYIQEHLSQ